MNLPCVTLTGAATPVPPPLPPSPVPVAPDASPSTFVGTYAVDFQTTVQSHQGSFQLIIANTGQVSGSGFGFIDSDANTYSMTLSAGQVAAGGFITMTGSGSPVGPLIFTGRFEFVGQGPSGTWDYEVEPAGTAGTRTFSGFVIGPPT